MVWNPALDTIMNRRRSDQHVCRVILSLGIPLNRQFLDEFTCDIMRNAMNLAQGGAATIVGNTNNFILVSPAYSSPTTIMEDTEADELPAVAGSRIHFVWPYYFKDGFRRVFSRYGRARTRYVGRRGGRAPRSRLAVYIDHFSRAATQLYGPSG
jgi:hypothetical protein